MAVQVVVDDDDDDSGPLQLQLRSRPRLDMDHGHGHGHGRSSHVWGFCGAISAAPLLLQLLLLLLLLILLIPSDVPEERIEQTMSADVVDGVGKLPLLQYVDVLHGCSQRLATAHSFYSKIVPFKDNQELVAGIWACKQYCSYYRQNFVLDTTPIATAIGKLRSMTPKHHILETEIPIFARKWNTVGLFGEDIAETVHREVNVISNSVTNMKNQPLQLMQYIDDHLNICFELECKRVVKGGQGKKKKWVEVCHQYHSNYCIQGKHTWWWE